MGLGNDQARGDERNAARERIAEQAVGVGMMLVAPAAERDPGAAIDEQAGRGGGGGSGRGPATRQ